MLIISNTNLKIFQLSIKLHCIYFNSPKNKYIYTDFYPIIKLYPNDKLTNNEVIILLKNIFCICDYKFDIVNQRTYINKHNYPIRVNFIFSLRFLST